MNLVRRLIEGGVYLRLAFNRRNMVVKNEIPGKKYKYNVQHLHGQKCTLVILQGFIEILMVSNQILLLLCD